MLLVSTISEGLVALYKRLRAIPALMLSVAAVLAANGLFFTLSPAVDSTFSISGLGSYFSTPALGVSLIVLGTLIGLFFSLSMADTSDGVLLFGLCALSVLLSLFALSVLRDSNLKNILLELAFPSDPVAQVAISFLILAFLIAVGVAISIYITASDVTSDLICETRHLSGTIAVTLTLAGILLFCHKLGQLLLSMFFSDPPQLAQIVLGLVLFALFALGLVSIVRSLSVHFRHYWYRGIVSLTSIGLVRVGSVFAFVALSWFLSSAVFRGIAANGTLLAKMVGVVAAIAVPVVTGFFVMLLVIIFGADGLTKRLVGSVRVETILLSAGLEKLVTVEQAQSFIQVVSKEARTAKADKRLTHLFSSFLIGAFRQQFETAIVVLSELPVGGFEKVWVPVFKEVLHHPDLDQDRIADALFYRLHEAGKLQIVSSQSAVQSELFKSYEALASAEEAQLDTALSNALAHMKKSPQFQGKQVYFTALSNYSSLSSFKDIVNCATVTRTPDSSSQAAHIRLLAECNAKFEAVVRDARKSEQVELVHKLPYFAHALELLSQTTETASRLPEPDQHVVTMVARKWQRIVTSELMSLKGRAELKIELKQTEFYFWEQLSIPVLIQNVGNSVAEDIRIELINDENQYSLLDYDFNEVEILAPGNVIVINLSIRPRATGALRIALETTFTDFESSGKVHKFGNVVNVAERGSAPQEHVSNYEQFLSNPYIPGRPISTREMFFGRQDVLAHIQKSLTGYHQDNVVVLQGERRIGKTSILYHLIEEFSSEYIPILIDAQGILSRGTEYFLWQFASLIQEKLAANSINVPIPELSDAQREAEIWLRQKFLSDVRKSLDARKLLILFDEFDSLEDRIREGDLDKEIFPFFRSLMQHEDWICFVFSGTHRLERMVSEYWSILFNIAVYVRLDFLTKGDARRLIVEPVTGVLEYDEFAIERILAVSSLHPYFLQLICFFLYNQHAREGTTYVTAQDVERVVDEVIDTQTHTHFIWKDSSRTERYILAAIASETRQENSVVTPFIVRNILATNKVDFSQTIINDALTTLTKKGILSSDATLTQFQFRVELVRRWLRRYKSLGAVIDEEGRTTLY